MGVRAGGASKLADVGGWQLVHAAGEGASSVVYEGRRDGVRGAVKVLGSGFGLGEAAILARLGRRWGPALLDAGRDGGKAFVVTEWVDGDPAASAPGDERRAWAVLHAIARALEELHDAGVRHGDVKPGNVLVHARIPARDAPDERAATLIDFGLAAGFGESAHGGTARYAAPELRSGGDVGPRADVFALGVMIEELLDGASSPALARIARAMQAVSPGARPRAGWLADRAARALGLAEEPRTRAEARVDAVRRAYVALRAREIARASSVEGDVVGAPRAWLDEAVSWARRIAPSDSGTAIGASSPLLRSRWLVSLVGASALAWPVPSAGEAAFAARMCELADKAPFGAWTFADFQGAAPAEGNASDDASLALALARPYPPEVSIAQTEARAASDAAMSPALRDALVSALVRGGDSARAMLVLRDAPADPPSLVQRAEVARRSGDPEGATEAAQAAIAAGASAPLASRASAVLARLAWDRGDDARATALLESRTGSAVAEVTALVACRRGAFDAALARLDEALALEDDAIASARLYAARGWVDHAAGRADAALADYARAVDLARRAGAPADEASYLVGEASAANAAGDVGRALAAATRGALLLERLGRLREASRAWLARAGALATVGDVHGADEAVAEIDASDAADARTRSYARWARVETRADDDPLAREEALAALAELGPTVLGPSPSAPGEIADDALRAAARGLVWAHDVVDPSCLAALDAACVSSSPTAAWEWLGARACRCVLGGALDVGAADVVARLLAIAVAPAPLASRGPALAAARDLAMKLGEGEAARRFETLRRADSSKLRETTPPELKDTLAQVAWTRDAAVADDSALAPGQIAQLETIVRSLSTRDRLRPLLLQVLDAMVLWVGVERGLLLLRAPNGKLAARAARNLAREDLRGEQLALSMTLAKRAMETGEAIVATDAFATLGDVHASVHALRLRSVLAVPLLSRGETLGVVYLDDRGRRGAFGPRELSWVRLLASQAAMAIADARDQVLLRRAVRRAERARGRVEELLAEREAELLQTRTELSRARGDETRFRYDAIAGRSEPMRALLRVVDRVTTSDVPVLLVGESGTGKELIARAMHENGPRARRAFVSENCAAVPESLLESTLFGHVRGAFTGASQTRAGLFEVADGGTLFLDEIGEMPLAMQAKLLRVLQDGEVRAVGSERTRKVDVRLLAATHRNLEEEVKAGRFREDLYYRLNVVTLRMPPLRERRGDIGLIISHLVKKHAAGKKVRLTKAAMDRLVSFGWPGNVRQLENEIRRALVLCSPAEPGDEAIVDAPDLSPDLLRGDDPREIGTDLRSRVDALEADLLRDALDKTHGNQTKAAELLGLSRFGLQKMMRRLKVAGTKPS